MDDSKYDIPFAQLNTNPTEISNPTNFSLSLNINSTDAIIDTIEREDNSTEKPKSEEIFDTEENERLDIIDKITDENNEEDESYQEKMVEEEGISSKSPDVVETSSTDCEKIAPSVTTKPKCDKSNISPKKGKKSLWRGHSKDADEWKKLQKAKKASPPFFTTNSTNLLIQASKNDSMNK